MSGWRWYWLTWAVVTFTAFLVPEVVALATNWRNTLSASVWDLESFLPGQPVAHWSAAHFWFIAVYGVLVLWLFFHFGMGWWR